MRITERKLRRIIREEAKGLMSERQMGPAEKAMDSLFYDHNFGDEYIYDTIFNAYGHVMSDEEYHDLRRFTQNMKTMRAIQNVYDRIERMNPDEEARFASAIKDNIS